jgi:hypothetical protein
VSCVDIVAKVANNRQIASDSAAAFPPSTSSYCTLRARARVQIDRQAGTRLGLRCRRQPTRSSDFLCVTRCAAVPRLDGRRAADRADGSESSRFYASLRYRSSPFCAERAVPRTSEMSAPPILRNVRRFILVGHNHVPSKFIASHCQINLAVQGFEKNGSQQTKTGRRKTLSTSALRREPFPLVERQTPNRSVGDQCVMRSAPRRCEPVENRCAECDGKLGLVCHPYWGLRFCRKACKDRSRTVSAPLPTTLRVG